MKTQKILLGIAYAILFVSAVISIALPGGSIPGVVFATLVVGGTYTDQMQIFRRGLSKKLEKLVWRYSKWSKLTDIIDVKKFKEAGTYAGAQSLPTPKNLVGVYKDFEREGGIYMDIPIRTPLTGKGRVGAAPLRGHEEKRKILTKKVAINQLRHAVEIQDNKMSKQMLRKPEIQMSLMERGQSDLQDWFTRRIGAYPYQAILGGYSDNLTDPSWGINFSLKSHPNLYVVDYGKVPFSNVFNAAYETAVETGLATLVAADEKAFKLQTIRNMVYIADQHKVEPILINGKLLYILFIHPAQAWQLKKDPEYQSYVKDAGVRGDQNVVWTGALEGTMVEGCLILIDATIPAARISGDVGYDATFGTVNYGLDTYMETPRDTAPRKPAIICGAGCVSSGYGSELGFESENADYSQFLGDAADMIIGFERADIIDDDNYFGNGAGAFYENASSIVFFTYSPDTLTAI
jgi:hypothetical protein